MAMFTPPQEIERTTRGQPFVSVLMPAYNAGKFIDEAIRSILEQSHKEFELIIIDDGSKDDTFDRAACWAASDSRIRLLSNAQNSGLVYTLNRLLHECRSETKYIARMDSDDISVPNRLASQVNFLEENSDFYIVGGHNIIIDVNGKTIGIRRYPTSYNEILKALTRFSPFSHPTVMLRHKIISEVGPYNEKYSACEDYDLWLRIASKYKVANLDEVLLKYRISKNQVKQTQLRLTIRQVLELQKHWLWHPELRSFRNITHWCVLHLMLLLPGGLVFTLFKVITYSTPTDSSNN